MRQIDKYDLKSEKDEVYYDFGGVVFLLFIREESRIF